MTATANKIIIVQGQTAAVTVNLVDASKSKPFNLAGLTGATGIFPKADGTGMAVTGVLQSSDLGSLTFTMEETDTPNLLVGDDQGIQVQVDQGSVRSIAQLDAVLSVKAPLYTF